MVDHVGTVIMPKNLYLLNVTINRSLDHADLERACAGIGDTEEVVQSRLGGVWLAQSRTGARGDRHTARDMIVGGRARLDGVS